MAKRVIYGSNNAPKGSTKDAAGNYTAPASTPTPNTSGGSTGATTAGVAPSTATQTALNTAGIKDTSGLNMDAVNKIAAGKATQDTPSTTYYPRYTANEQAASDYLDTFQAPKSADKIQVEKLKAAQGEINSLNDYYGTLLKEQQTINQGNERATASVNTLTGLAGSTEANVTSRKEVATSQQANDKILAHKQLELNTLLTNIRTSAETEATTQQTNARQSAVDIMTNRATKRTEATQNVTQLASSGVTVEGLKTSDPKSYEYLAKQVGGEGQLKAMFTLNRPQDTILDKKIEGGKYIISYQNPLTGSVRIETLDLDLPLQYTKTIDAGDRMLAIPDNWSGDPSELITINKGLSPDQMIDNNLAAYNAETARMKAGGTGSGASGLSGLAQAVVNGTVSLSDLTPSQRGKVAGELATAGQNPNLKANRTIATDALTALNKVLDRVNAGENLAIGASSILPTIPGTKARDFVKDFDNLKGLLSLDAVQYLKGTGQLSDAEQRLLANAATSLGRDQSEDNFKKTLETLRAKLAKVAYAEGAGGTFENSAAGAEGDDIDQFLNSI